MVDKKKIGSGRRKAELKVHFSEFDLPPMQDVLLIGRRAPIGPEAVRRMVDALAPGQYEVIPVQDSPIEAVAVKSILFNWISRDILLDFILEEANKLTSEESLIKVKINVTVSVSKEVDL